MSDEKPVEQEAQPEVKDEQSQATSEEVEKKEEATTSPENTSAEKPKKNGAQKRIDEITRDKYDAIKERDYWRKEALKNKEAPPAQQAPEAKEAPKQDDYEDYDDYLVAKAEYNVEQKLRAENAKKTAEQKEAERNQKQQQNQQNFNTHAEKAREKYDDFDTVALNPTLPTSDAMYESIVESDMGAEVLYYLGQHMDEAYGIAQMSDLSAAREIGRIEAKLSLPQSKTVSDAPEPIESIGSKESVSTDMESLPINDWMAKRNKQVGQG